jgi:NADH:ubiquinone reductase (H+-translocating)
LIGGTIASSNHYSIKSQRGSLSAGEIASPLRSLLSRQKNTRVWLGTVVDVDSDSKRVVLADGTIVPYDSLIVAAGSQTSYFGHNEWQEWAPGLKSIEEATTVRRKILYAFEVAERLSDAEQRRAWLSFVILEQGPRAWTSPAQSPKLLAKP